MVLSKKSFYIILSLCLFINVVVAFASPISSSPAVYWFYAQHLRWVYTDAPPLIAVTTWLGITVFGSHNATINFLGLLSVLISVRFLYLLAKSMFNENIARISSFIWLITPTTLHYYFRWSWSYNNLILVFSIMATYFFYQAGKIKSPRYFYFTALSLIAAFLSQITGIVLILTLLVPLVFLPSYHVFFKNKHFYFSLSLLFLAIVFYVILLWQLDWLPFKYQLQFHSSSGVSHVFFLKSVIQQLLDVFNELNLFFIIGLWLVFKNFQTIKKNEDLMFCLLVGGALFLLAFIGSTRYGLAIRYYYPFYFTFVLLFISFAQGRWVKYLTLGIYINIVIFLINSWNVILPQYGIGTGSNPFNSRNFETMGHAVKSVVKPNDVLILCGKSADNGDLVTVAFQADHINTYFTSPGLFIWQAPLQQVLAQNKGGKIFYLCNEQTFPEQSLNLTCGAWQTLSSTLKHYLQNKAYTNTDYLSQCIYSKGV